MMSLSYAKVSADTKAHKSIAIILNGKEAVLKEGTHYRLYF